jgi:hypothetical protein
MAKQHQSFVVRCWRLDRGEKRIEIEHIQSGEKYLAHSTAEANEWICARMSDPQRAPPEEGERSGPERHQV